MAYGVYAAAARLGLRIPEDVSVLGYDDDPVSRLLTPPLSNFRWPVDELVVATPSSAPSARSTRTSARAASC